MDEDDQCMRELQGGDGSAFDELVERHYGPLVGFFCRQQRDRQLAEDLAQETLLRVYNEVWDYIPQGRFRAWMYRIARNLLIDTVRRHSYDALVGARAGGDPELQLARLAASGETPAELAGGRETVALVGELLDSLPADQRLTFTLHHYLELSLPEVAEVMEASVSTTKSRLRLAREKLTDRLARHGVNRDEWEGTRSRRAKRSRN
jgi:RNA polymerase sigma-70 factor (ECF subfamily)